MGFTVTFMFHSFFSSMARSKYSSVFSFSLIFTLWSARTVGSLKKKQSLGLVFKLRLSDLFASQNPREFCVSHSPGRILVSTYTISQNGQIPISWTIHSGSLFPPSHVKYSGSKHSSFIKKLRTQKWSETNNTDILKDNAEFGVTRATQRKSK